MRRRCLALVCLILGLVLGGIDKRVFGQELRVAVAATDFEISEVDGLHHMVVPEGETLRQAIERLPCWVPWQPAMFDASTILWVDFAKLPADLEEFGQRGKQTWYGVPVYPLQVVCQFEEAEADPLALAWSTQWL